MASLGGARAVQTACESVLHDRQAPLEIRFRPDDPLARGLCAERVDVNGLVLRVSRPRASAAPPRVDAIARVARVFHFASLADFQHTRAATHPELAALSGVAPVSVPGSSAANANPPGGGGPSGHPFACVIPDGPADDPFRVGERAAAALSRVAGVGSLVTPPPSAGDRTDDYLRAAARGFADGASARGRRKDFKAERDFAERSVPPWLGEPSADSGCSRETFDALRDLFERRPAWAHVAALEAVPAGLRKAAEAALPRVAYKFANGPFRKVWIRRGVDPRLDRSFAKYQVIEVRQPPSFVDGEKGVRGAAKTTTSHADAHAFRALPVSRYPAYQLCDIDLGGVRATLEALAADPSAPARCLEQMGFLTRIIQGRIRDCVSAANRALYEGRDPRVAADDVLREKEEEERRVAAAKIRAGSNKRARDAEDEEEEEEEEDDPDEEEDDPDEDDPDEDDLGGSGVEARVAIAPETVTALERGMSAGGEEGTTAADIDALVRQTLDAEAAREDDGGEYDVLEQDDDEDDDD